MLNLGTGPLSAGGGATATAAQAVNELGLELLARGAEPGVNALLSPYSIQSALAMTFAGASGATRAEMAKVLHYPADEVGLHRSFAALQQALEDVRKSTAARAAESKQWGGPSDPITLTVANCLFGQKNYAFRDVFLSLVKDTYGAPLQPVDFVGNSPQARLQINGWVEEQTQQRIRDLIPPEGVSPDTRLVLVNAIYLKAPWMQEFAATATKPLLFYVAGGEPPDVATMYRQGMLGYGKREGCSAVTIPYSGGDLQFLILLPEAKDGLPALEAKLTAAVLGSCANLDQAELQLYLPKFKIEPPLFKLGKALRSLGMLTAFDEPKGSADFDRMVPRKPDDYLFISEVFHKTFLALDEKGTEAAAATAVSMAAPSAVVEKPKPIEVRVDHPFLFAIQHRPSGACLFLGRVTDPRRANR